MNISTRQLTAADWQEFSQIRLKALKTDPEVFGSNYERESKYTETDWRARLEAEDTAIFMIYENELPIGVTGVSINRSDPSAKSAILWGTWLAPHARGKGISKLLYRTRIEWAKRQPGVEKVIVSHRASNLASKHANQKHGFVFTHRIEKNWSDGVTEDEVFYELRIRL